MQSKTSTILSSHLRKRWSEPRLVIGFIFQDVRWADTDLQGAPLSTPQINTREAVVPLQKGEKRETEASFTQ